jgi:hypothetical protein
MRSTGPDDPGIDFTGREDLLPTLSVEPSLPSGPLLHDRLKQLSRLTVELHRLSDQLHPAPTHANELRLVPLI